MFLKKIITGFVKSVLKIIRYGKMEKTEKVVTIVSYEEFQELVRKTGNNDLTTMELVDAIAQINAIIYEATEGYGKT